LPIRTLSKHLLTLLASLMLVIAGCGSKDEDFIRSGKDLLEKNDRSAALIQFKNAAQKNPNDPEARYLLGVTLFRLGDPASAAAELEKARSLGIEDDRVMKDLARALIAAGDLARATTELSTAKPVTPASKATLLAIRGDIHFVRNEIQKAAEAYQASLVADAGNAFAKVGLARMAIFEKKPDDAMRLLDEVLAADGAFFDALFLKGAQLMGQGQGPEALTMLRKASALQPWDMRPLGSLITLQLSLQDIKGADESFAALKKSAAGPELKHYASAQIDYAKGNLPAARDSIRRALESRPDDPSLLFLSGRIEHDLGNLMLAEKQLEQVVSAAPDDLSSRVLLTATYLRSGKIVRAKNSLAKLQASYPDDLNVLRLTGELAMAEQRTKDAVASFQKAAERDKTSSPAYLRLGRARIAAGERDAGQNDLQTAVNLDPANLEAQEAVLVDLVKKKDFKGAMSHVAAIEAKLPDRVEPYYMHGLVLAASGDRKASREKLDKAATMSPGFFPAVRALAQLDVEAGKLEDAKNRYRQILKVNPRLTTATFLLADLMERTKTPKSEIIGLLDEAIAANATDSQVRLKKVDYLVRLGDRKGALDAIQETRVAFPEDPNVLALAARTQALSRDYSQAISTYSKLVGMQSSSPEPLLGRASVYAAQKDWIHALESVRQAIVAFPDHQPAYSALIDVRVRAKQFDEALADVKLIEKRWPGSALYYVESARIYAAMKRPGDAERLIREGLAKLATPSMAQLLYVTLSGNGRPDDADRALRQWLERHPDDVASMMLAFSVRLSKKQYRESVEWVRRAVQKKPDDAVLVNNLAFALGKAGEREALVVARRAVELAPKSIGVRETLGVLQVQFGETAAGVETLQGVLQKLPKSASTRIALARGLVALGKPAEAKSALDQAEMLATSPDDKSEIAEIRKRL
jgi:putative PEP-CTERM system TPR-repeat lipoprotein